MRHDECGEEYLVIPSNFLSDYRCPIWKERSIREFLARKNINFKRQYTFKGLVELRGFPLRFDFTILDRNDILTALIEYDGEYHFQAVQGEEKLKYQQAHDKLKNSFIKDSILGD
ncbi:hypothetical protein COD76_11490 [Bacillus cereus]|uniref:hypothetical protein n=1 Tax=Bacillus sp. S0628 TaxID=2957802 RepID=UPI000BFBC851|nr:hypothetical protein [Bacillus sp. S0628]PGU82110.1 hypothetical protein COD76_11490 [Bacillus cereus]